MTTYNWEFYRVCVYIKSSLESLPSADGLPPTKLGAVMRSERWGSQTPTGAKTRICSVSRIARD